MRMRVVVKPDGGVDVLDVSRRYLDHTTDTVRRAGLDNVTPTLGDGRSLPYSENSFDAAYLVTVIGEIRDPPQAIRELRRVVRPGGRIVFGETLIDPDYPRLGWLRERAGEAGLELERRIGSPLGYFARFRLRSSG
jgi:ubiquinone/menaquinone biosynthesis C-methylase UbiE